MTLEEAEAILLRAFRAADDTPAELHQLLDAIAPETKPKIRKRR